MSRAFTPARRNAVPSPSNVPSMPSAPRTDSTDAPMRGFTPARPSSVASTVSSSSAQSVISVAFTDPLDTLFDDQNEDDDSDSDAATERASIYCADEEYSENDGLNWRTLDYIRQQAREEANEEVRQKETEPKSKEMGTQARQREARENEQEGSSRELEAKRKEACDVCFERYTKVNAPHAITCGHVFCQKCLDHLVQYCKCPFCRGRFSPRDVRKLCMGHSPSTGASELPSEPVAVEPHIDGESQRLLDDIARIVKEGGKVGEIRRVIGECRRYYKSQPGNQYTPVRVSCLLLHNLLEAQRKLFVQGEELREMTTELGAIRLKYDDLERTSMDEKETALATEKNLREHYDQMNNFWKGQMDSVNQDCQSLREELDRYRSSGTAAPPPREIGPQYFYRNDPKRSYSGSGESA